MPRTKRQARTVTGASQAPTAPPAERQPSPLTQSLGDVLIEAQRTAQARGIDTRPARPVKPQPLVFWNGQQFIWNDEVAK